MFGKFLTNFIRQPLYLTEIHICRYRHLFVASHTIDILLLPTDIASIFELDHDLFSDGIVYATLRG